MARKSSGAFAEFWEIVKTLLWAGVIAIVIRTFAYEPFNIPSGSMKPTLLVGDYLFVSKFSYGYSRYSLPFGLPLMDGRLFGSLPERGDVVVFKLPSDNSTDYIKRVVGLPGDRIQVVDGILHVNGQPVKVEPLGMFEDEERGRTAEIPMFQETLPDGVQHVDVVGAPGHGPGGQYQRGDETERDGRGSRKRHAAVVSFGRAATA